MFKHVFQSKWLVAHRAQKGLSVDDSDDLLLKLGFGFGDLADMVVKENAPSFVSEELT